MLGYAPRVPRGLCPKDSLPSRRATLRVILVLDVGLTVVGGVSCVRATERCSSFGSSRKGAPWQSMNSLLPQQHPLAVQTWHRNYLEPIRASPESDALT